MIIKILVRWVQFSHNSDSFQVQHCVPFNIYKLVLIKEGNPREPEIAKEILKLYDVIDIDMI